MPKREFSIEPILFCVATALGKKGFYREEPHELQEFLTGQAASFRDLEDFEILTVMCGLILLDQHPRLELQADKLQKARPFQDAFEDDRPFTVWLDNQRLRFGDTLEAASVPRRKRGQYRRRAEQIADRNIKAKLPPGETDFF